MSAQELANRFGYSRSWGRDRIKEVRAETIQPTAGQTTTDDRATIEQEDIAFEEARQTASATARRGVRTGQPASARRVAWLAFIVGIAASVAANVMHAQTVSTSRAAWIGAAFWPIGLLLAIEVLARVRWPSQSRWYTVTRYAGTSMVATVAAVLSYRHMAGLLASWGEDTLSAYLGPLAVDGLMIIAASALLVENSRSHLT